MSRLSGSASCLIGAHIKRPGIFLGTIRDPLCFVRLSPEIPCRLLGTLRILHCLLHFQLLQPGLCGRLRTKTCRGNSSHHTIT